MGKISDETDNIFLVTLPGYNVDTTTPEECAFHSGFDYPKIEESLEGHEEIVIPSTISEGTTVLKTVSHNYGYVPNALVFIEIVDEDPILYNTEFAMLPLYPTDPVIIWYDFNVTSTTLTIQINYDDLFSTGDLTPGDGSPAGKTVGFKWQIWVND